MASSRDQGKAYFQRGKFSAAADSYTEAIAMEPSDAALFQNRALCFQKLARWQSVVDDATKAAELAPSSVKAHYLLATGFSNLEKTAEAEREFGVAEGLAAAPENAQYRMSIQQGLHALYARQMEAEHHREADQDIEDMRVLEEMVRERRDIELAQRASLQPEDGEGGGDGEGGAAMLAANREVDERCSNRLTSLRAVGERARKLRERPAVPEALCCQITFDLMVEPTMTPSGQTYEKDSLHQHLTANGMWDPVTRQPLGRHQLVENKSLKTVIKDFLRKNPWAWGL